MYSINSLSLKLNPSGTKKLFCRDLITINEGDCVHVSGESGCGKSTLLKILKGIIPEFSAQSFEGEVLYKGFPLAGEYFKNNLKEILFLFQNPFSQVIHPSVPEEFFFTMENFNFSHEEMLQEKKKLSAVFGLDRIWEKNTFNLSNGECQKLVLASLLAVKPKVLLIDEPTAFLDPKSRAEFYQWIMSVKGTMTLVIVDHHVREMASIADYALFVDEKGEITKISTEQLIHQNDLKSSSDYGIKNILSSKNKLTLKIRNVSYRYKDSFDLIKNVNLEAYPGQISVIKGQNGSGKSTLFKIISGLIAPKEGEVKAFEGSNIVRSKILKEKIAFIFQNPESHFFYDTIAEELGAKLKIEAIKKLAELFLIGVDFDRSPFLLSEGEKRRLSILMALVQSKSVFLFDEPTFGQDQRSKKIIVDIILELKKLGMTQFIISHDQDFISLVADRIYEIKDQSLESLK